MQTEKIKENENALAVYEVSYLLLPSLAERLVPAKVTALKDMLNSLGGAIISEENPVFIDLAYPMIKVVGTVRHKATNSYFGWIKFEMAKEGILAIKKALDSKEEVLRYLIIKTVRENTLLNGKMMLKKEEKAKRDEDEILADIPEAEKEIISEDLNKSIDDLVIV